MAKEEDIFPDAPEELTMDNAIDEMNAEQVLRSLALLLYCFTGFTGTKDNPDGRERSLRFYFPFLFSDVAYGRGAAGSQGEGAGAEGRGGARGRGALISSLSLVQKYTF